MGKIWSFIRELFSAPVDAASLRVSTSPESENSKSPEVSAPDVWPESPHKRSVESSLFTFAHDPAADPTTAWTDLLALLELRYPKLIKALNPPATEMDVDRFEMSAGVRLPSSIKQMYMTHNGASNERSGVFGGWHWLSLDAAADIRAEFNDLEASDPSPGYDTASALPRFWYEGDALYVECRDGAQSKLYYRDHEDPKRFEVAASIPEYLQEFAARIAADALIVDDSDDLCLKPPSRAYWPPDFDALYPRNDGA